MFFFFVVVVCFHLVGKMVVVVVVSLSQGDFARLTVGRSVVVTNVVDLVLEVERSLEVGAVFFFF